MSKTKRILAFALAAVLAVVVLSGCKSIAQKVFGSSNEVQEDDTTQWAVLSSDPLVIDGIADTTAKICHSPGQRGAEHRVQRHLEPPDRILHRAQRPAEHLRLRHHRRRCPRSSRSPSGKRWTAARSMWTTPPSISPPMARTTTATLTTLIPTQATALPFPTIPAVTTSTV